MENKQYINNIKLLLFYLRETTMAFVQAMNSLTSIKMDINDETIDIEDNVENYCVALFTMLNRSLSYSYISEYIGKILATANKEQEKDLFVMAFHTRDIRGGKGEKKLFYDFISGLYFYKPYLVKKLLEFVPEYGCWRDMWALLVAIPELSDTILQITKEQFEKDMILYTLGENTSLSLLAKWLPRENSGTYPKMARKIANFIYPTEYSDRKRIVQYRKNIAQLNSALKTVEINMCSHDWKSINPEAVPGRCLKIHTKAFLNENKLGETRYSDDTDRDECRAHFQEFIEGLKNSTKKAHGAHVVMPHELVANTLSCTTGIEEQEIIQGQWDSIRESVKEGGGLGKCVPMCDFSGSMNGQPKLISLALGILISEINHPSFKDHILTFDSNPKWHSFAGKETLKDKLASISGDLSQGLNTDFYKACMAILEKMKQAKVPVGEEPEDLIVLTDMGWNQANCSNKYKRTYDTWSSQLKLIRDVFQIAGEELWGEGCGWKVPRIVVWNLSSKYNDFHIKASDEGAVMLSGWSPSILKSFQLNGMQSSMSYYSLRHILDNPRYDTIRIACDAFYAAQNEINDTI